MFVFSSIPDPWILSCSGGKWNLWALFRPDLCLRWDCGSGLQRECQPGSDPHLHRDGLPWGEGVPCSQRGEITMLLIVIRKSSDSRKTVICVPNTKSGWQNSRFPQSHHCVDFRWFQKLFYRSSDAGKRGQGRDEEEGQGTATGQEGRRAFWKEGADFWRLRQQRHDQRLVRVHHHRHHRWAREAQDHTSPSQVLH